MLSDIAMERHNQPVEISPSECSTLPAYVYSNGLNKNCLLCTDNHHYKTSTPQGKTSLVKTCRLPRYKVQRVLCLVVTKR